MHETGTVLINNINNNVKNAKHACACNIPFREEYIRVH